MAKSNNDATDKNDVEDTGMIIPPIPSGDDFENDPKVRQSSTTLLVALITGDGIH